MRPYVPIYSETTTLCSQHDEVSNESPWNARNHSMYVFDMKISLNCSRISNPCEAWVKHCCQNFQRPSMSTGILEMKRNLYLSKSPIRRHAWMRSLCSNRPIRISLDVLTSFSSVRMQHPCLTPFWNCLSSITCRARRVQSQAVLHASVLAYAMRLLMRPVLLVCQLPSTRLYLLCQSPRIYLAVYF